MDWIDDFQKICGSQLDQTDDIKMWIKRGSARCL